MFMDLMSKMWSSSTATMDPRQFVRKLQTDYPQFTENEQVSVIAIYSPAVEN